MSAGGAPITTAIGNGAFLLAEAGLILAEMLRGHHADPHVVAAYDLDPVP